MFVSLCAYSQVEQEEMEVAAMIKIPATCNSIGKSFGSSDEVVLIDVVPPAPLSDHQLFLRKLHKLKQGEQTSI